MVINGMEKSQDSQNNRSENPESQARRKEKRSKDALTDKELRQVAQLDAFIAGLPEKSMHLQGIVPILSLVLSFVKIFLPENIFRYLLGLLSFFTYLSIREIANMAKCSTKVVQRGRKEVILRTPLEIRRQRIKGGGRRRNADYEFNKREIIKFVRLRAYGPCTKSMQEYTAATISGIQTFMMERYHQSISRGQIHRILRQANIRLRMNRKLLYGNQQNETDQQRTIRHMQFDLIRGVLEKDVDSPDAIVLSCDAKKTEYLGNRAAPKQMWSMPGEPVNVTDHDFQKVLEVKTLTDMDDLLDRQEGKAIPQALYDISTKKAYILVGISHDTSEFACRTIAHFFDTIKKDHPGAKKLILLCDGGGAYSARTFQFKLHALKLSCEIGMPVYVYHYPPYRSKFNKIERHLFAPLSLQYQHARLLNLRTLIALTNNTVTKTGLTVQAEVDATVYETGQKVTEEQQKLISDHVVYFGITKKAENKLSYVLDGTHISKTDLPQWSHLTVFDIKENIELTKEQKQLLKKQKEEARAARVKAKEMKEQNQAGKPAAKSQKTRTESDSKGRGEKADHPTAAARRKSSAA